MTSIYQDFAELDCKSRKLLEIQLNAARIVYNNIADYTNLLLLIGDVGYSPGESKQNMASSGACQILANEIYNQIEANLMRIFTEKLCKTTISEIATEINLQERIIKRKNNRAPLKIEIKGIKTDEEFWYMTLPSEKTFKPRLRFPLPDGAKGARIEKVILREYPYKHSRNIQFVFNEDLPLTAGWPVGLGIDVGLVNLMTCVTSTGRILFVSGKNLRDAIEIYSKRFAFLQKEKRRCKQPPTLTKAQRRANKKFNDKVNDCLYSAVQQVGRFCKQIGAAIVVFGLSRNFTKKVNLSKTLNRQASYVPYRRICEMMEAWCQKNGIAFVIQEESFTSQASFFDGDRIPAYGEKFQYAFSGKRIDQDLYITKNGKAVHADVNAALNILRKSQAVPIRIAGIEDLSKPIYVNI